MHTISFKRLMHKKSPSQALLPFRSHFELPTCDKFYWFYWSRSQKSRRGLGRLGRLGRSSGPSGRGLVFGYMILYVCCSYHSAYVDQIKENILNFISGIGLQISVLTYNTITNIIGLSEIKW